MTLVLLEDGPNGLATITLNDPENLNAMSEAMADEFSQLVKTLRLRAVPPRVIILTGAGRAFSAGGDLGMLERKQKLSPEENRSRMISFYESFLGIRALNVPLIAAINGSAIGAGLCVASACDMRVAAAGVKLGFTFVKLGLHPGMGATYFLPRILGPAMAAELMFTGRVIDASRAGELGLVTHIVPGERVITAAEELAAEICGAGPLAIRDLVETLRGDARELYAALEREASAQARSYASEEFKEGLRAAREKRPPHFP